MGKTKLISLNDLSLEELEVDADLIPLMTTDDEEAISKEPVPEEIPILPLRNTVLFPWRVKIIPTTSYLVFFWWSPGFYKKVIKHKKWFLLF